MEEAVIKLYQYLYGKVYKRQSAVTYEKNKSLIDNFFKQFEKEGILLSIGNNFLIDFFLWSFAIRVAQDTKRDITLNWIIGKKTINRWLHKTEEYRWTYAILVRELDIDIPYLETMLVDQAKIVTGIDTTEEKEKGRIIGEARFYNCLTNTTLFNHRSFVCITCEMKTVCKRVLKEKFPALYSSRGYAL